MPSLVAIKWWGDFSPTSLVLTFGLFSLIWTKIWCETSLDQRARPQSKRPKEVISVRINLNRGSLCCWCETIFWKALTFRPITGSHDRLTSKRQLDEGGKNSAPKQNKQQECIGRRGNQMLNRHLIQRLHKQSTPEPRGFQLFSEIMKERGYKRTKSNAT